MKTVVLLSGGLDSAVVLALCVAEGDECLAIGIDYGQPHVRELKHAAELAVMWGVPFMQWSVPAMPLVNDVVFAGRNLMLVSVAVSVAQAKGYERIAVGCNADDHERFPDCRPEFWRALDAAVYPAYGIAIATPLLRQTKKDIVRLAREYRVPIEKTWSCYDPRAGKPCGVCLACKVREGVLA